MCVTEPSTDAWRKAPWKLFIRLKCHITVSHPLDVVDNTGLIFGSWKEYKPGSIDLATPAPPPGSLDPQQTFSRLLDDGTRRFGALSCPLCDRPSYVLLVAFYTLHSGHKMTSVISGHL